jgi:hypothetical protein
VDEGEYQRILAGEYPRREDDREASVAADAKAAADSYRETFNRSQDPLVSLLRRLGDGAEVGEWVGAGASRVRTWVSTAGDAASRASRRSGGASESTETGSEGPDQ